MLPKAYALLVVGAVALTFAILRPSWVQSLPGSRWFGLFPGSQYSFIVISLGVILYGVGLLGLIPKSYQGLVLVLWGFAFVGGAVHDMTKGEEE